MTWYPWIVASVLLLVVEIMTPGVLFFACLSFGALAAGLSTLINVPYWAPWIVFLLISIFSIYFVRPIAKKFFKLNVKKSNVDALIGQQAWVTQAIKPPQLGTVKIHGETWRAESTQEIAENTYVEVTAVKGTHLEVSKK